MPKPKHLPLKTKVYIAHNSKLVIGQVEEVLVSLAPSGYTVKYRINMEHSGERMLKLKHSNAVYDSLDSILRKVGEL